MSARIWKAAAAIAAIAALAGGGAIAMEWPLPGAALLRNFSFNDFGRPHPGVTLAGGGAVLASAAGEVFFVSSGLGVVPASGFPSPLGEWVAVDHGNGFVSVYARLGEVLAGGDRWPRVEAGDPLGSAGVSGWSGAEGALFMLHDRRERRWVNPAVMLPPLPDALAPQILGIWLLGEDGSMTALAPGLNVPQGRYGIVVAVEDALSYGMGSGLAPHRVVVSVNGTEVGRLSMETITARDGEPIPARRVFAPFPAIEAGEAWLTRGQALIEIVAQDAAGNSASVAVQIAVE